jgi:hypothetical protein
MDSEDIVRKCHQKRGRIRDPEKVHPGSGSRIPGVKKHRIPDPDPQHWSTMTSWQNDKNPYQCISTWQINVVFAANTGIILY